MSKWNLTDTAIKRIEGRLADLRKEVDSTEWYFNPIDLLLRAMKPEDYARPRGAAEELIQIWIRDGKQGWLCSACFKSYALDRKELRQGGRDLMNGIRRMGRMKL